MMATASRGKAPLAVSPESITASVPSSTAFATSEHSARVGRGFEIIDSSICVATTQGLPAARHLAIIIFCSRKTFSGGISMPRSPRATMTPSVAARISSNLSSPSWFSIFAITLMAEPSPCLDSLSVFLMKWMSSADWTKEAAMKSTLFGTPKFCRSSMSLGCSTGRSTLTLGRFMFLRSPIDWLFSTRQMTEAALHSLTVSTSEPSAMRMVEPFLTEVGSLSYVHANLVSSPRKE
mmetsp:Transcript_27326/g.81559  ORF Transcript_27326/g.81559 Transcript_27326/m.81559 type:complete len:236 (-) Transcript_27326:336-1043(-)